MHGESVPIVVLCCVVILRSAVTMPLWALLKNVKGSLRGLTSSWRPVGPLYFVFRALWTLKPNDPH